MQDYKGDFIRVFNELSHSKNSNQVWNDLIECVAITISNALDKKNYNKREAEYMEKAARLDYSPKMGEALACIVSALEDKPEQDFLGAIYV